MKAILHTRCGCTKELNVPYDRYQEPVRVPVQVTPHPMAAMDFSPDSTVMMQIREFEFIEVVKVMGHLQAHYLEVLR